MREARVKGIARLGGAQAGAEGYGIWQIAYDEHLKDENEGESKCPMVWRTHAKDELDIWIKFNEWFKGNTNKGEPNNVIWL